MIQLRTKLRARERWAGELGQAAVEVALIVPLAMTLLFGVYQLARVFYVYHTLQKAVRGGAGLLARTGGVNYCDASDPNITAVKNFIVFGNLQGGVAPIVTGLDQTPINIVGERLQTGLTSLDLCPCGTGDADSCDISGGRAPDFVVINLGDGGSGFPLSVVFPFVTLNPPSLNLKVSVRMPVTSN